MISQYLNAPMLLLLLVAPVGPAMALWSSPAETSYTESYVVKAGDTSAASGGRLGYQNVHVSGRLTIQSCCGLSTNDIMFAISGEIFTPTKFYGIVVGSLNFEWDTGKDSEYSMIFNNIFNQSSPSYHQKTVQISVTEIGPPNSINTTVLFETIAGAILTTGIIIVGLFLYVKHRHRFQTPPAKFPSATTRQFRPDNL